MPEDNVAQAALDADRLKRAIDLRVRGAHWDEISKACGYPSAGAALQAVGRAMAAATQRAEETADQMRDTANLRLESLLRSTLNMLDDDAPMDVEGNVQDDRAVKLRAVDEARRLVESITKLNGVKPPEAEASKADGIRIIGIAAIDEII